MLLMLVLAMAAPQNLPVIERRRPSSEAAETPSEAEPFTADTPATPPLPERSAVVGEWRLGLARGGRRCVVRLDDIAMGSGLFSLWQNANCPEGLFPATRWRLSGASLELLDRNARPMAVLAPADAGWTGKRSGDGAAIQMDRLR
ncbi:AprI/Inh family metalloprotease inhibitor [Polymorphobacter sp.]|uniref:AprI/Inh family metalloprotease inhibitor n=1 Tax=Polymorphobacter sp. TaxID=1909290 RepID=UPI003F722E3E